MKFEFCGKKQAYTTFRELFVGSIFRSPRDTSLCVKINDAGTVLRLDNDELLDFFGYEEVIPIGFAIRNERRSK